MEKEEKGETKGRRECRNTLRNGKEKERRGKNECRSTLKIRAGTEEGRKAGAPERRREVGAYEKREARKE